MERLREEGHLVLPGIKVEEPDCGGRHAGATSAAGGRDLLVAQAETIGGALTGTSPFPIKQEPEDKWQRDWGAPWQDFLKQVPGAPRLGWENPQPVELVSGGPKGSEGSTNGVTAASRWPVGEPATPALAWPVPVKEESPEKEPLGLGV
ncbi:hypothetical protein lerEdw1_011191, partial [Lerista edwardsae]